MIVKINKEDYIKCEESAANMWCSSKKGMYGKGLLNTKNDPLKTERTGRLGEMALCIVINTDPDFAYRKFGDAGDFIIENKKIDIKTAARNYGELLVYGENEWGKKVNIKSDIYVAAVVIKDDIENKEAEIEILGWCNKEVLMNRELVPARYGKHKNYAVPHNELTNIDEFVKLVHERKI